MRAWCLNAARPGCLLVLVLLAGCGSSAAPTPTRVPATVAAPTPPSFPTSKPIPAPSMRPVPTAKASPVLRMSPLAQPTQQAKQGPTAIAQQPEGTDEPLPPPPATPQVHVPAAAELVALQRLTWEDRTHDGQVPGGCATLAGHRICVPPVTVDGKRLPDLAVIAEMITRPSTPRSIHEAIAQAVFQRLLYLEGRRAGIHATQAEGRTIAEGEMAAYEKDPTTRSLIPIPPGLSPRQYFLAPETIDAYRVGIITGRERDAILTNHVLSAPATFTAWMKDVLPRHTVTVAGRAPGFSLPTALQTAYACQGRAGC
jgi:hypothetical protein